MSTEELVERFRVEDVGQAVGDLRRAEAALDQRPLHARDAARRVHGGGRPPPRARARRAPARRLRDRPGEGADPGRGLAADPLPLRAAGRRREGLEQGDEGGDAGAARGGARRARRGRRLRPRRDRGGAGAAGRAPRRQAGQALPADPGRDHRHAPSRRGSSSRWRRWAARSRWPGSTPSPTRPAPSNADGRPPRTTRPSRHVFGRRDAKPNVLLLPMARRTSWRSTKTDSNGRGKAHDIAGQGARRPVAARRPAAASPRRSRRSSASRSWSSPASG